MSQLNIYACKHHEANRVQLTLTIQINFISSFQTLLDIYFLHLFTNVSTLIVLNQYPENLKSKLLELFIPLTAILIITIRDRYIPIKFIFLDMKYT